LHLAHPAGQAAGEASDCPSGENRTAEMRSDRPTSRASRCSPSADQSSTSWNPATASVAPSGAKSSDAMTGGRV